MTKDTHVQESLPAYTLGCLDENEAAFVAAHLAGCSVCQAELDALQRIADDLALAVPDATPPPDLRRRLMARISPTPDTPPGRTLRPPLLQRLVPAWGVVSLLLILALGVVNILLWQRLNQVEATITSGQMQAIPLTGTAAAPAASGMVVISPDGRNGAVIVDGLPPLDSTQEYQLWLIRDGQRTSGAVFSVDEDGYAGRRITAPDSLFEYMAVDISIEPAGGSPAPTGDNVLGGILAGSFNPGQP